MIMNGLICVTASGEHNILFILSLMHESMLSLVGDEATIQDTAALGRGLHVSNGALLLGSLPHRAFSSPSLAALVHQSQMRVQVECDEMESSRTGSGPSCSL